MEMAVTVFISFYTCKRPTPDNAAFSKGPSFNTEVGQTVALPALPVARSAVCLISSAFQIHLTRFSPVLKYKWSVTVNQTDEFDFSLTQHSHCWLNLSDAKLSLKRYWQGPQELGEEGMLHSEIVLIQTPLK